MTLEELSVKTGVPAPTLNRYELENRVPKVDVANNIAHQLNVDPLWLHGYSDEEYLYDPEVLEILEEAKNNPDLKMLFSVSRKIKPNELKRMIKMIEGFVKEEE